MRGKVVKGIAGFYYVTDRQGKIYECKARGIFRNRNTKLLVGDDVDFEILDEAERLGNVTEILPRKNKLIRPAAVNVDQVLLLFACREPEPNFGLLDRFLIQMDRQGCRTEICFGKCDLADPERREELKEIYRNTGYGITFFSSVTGEGMEEIRALLRGKTPVLAGPSGVGKTSLRNVLVPDTAGETGELSRKLQRGKHTTRHTEIFVVEEETYLLDTPGFTALELENAEPEEFREFFPEFMPFWNGCRFHGCLHLQEPDCLVKEAVATGRISRERYDSYCQMVREARERKRY